MGICSSRSPPANARHGQSNVIRAHRSRIRRAKGDMVNTLRDLGVYLPLYKAAVSGDWRDAGNFLEQDPEALTARITIAYETALHIAVGTGKNIDFVENLVQKMSPEDLTLTDQHSETALSAAAVVGNISAAMILVNKNPNLPNISGKYGFPVHKAAQFCHKKTVLYLLSVTRSDIEPNPFAGESGGRLLIDVIAADFYDIALSLVRRYPEMATMEVNSVDSALSVLARKSTVFSSGFVHISLKWRHFFWPVAYLREVYERRCNEKRAIELVKELCKEILELEDCKVFSMFQHALHDAAKLGVPEIIEEIVEVFPPAIWFTDENDYNVFQLAIMNRRENVFNLIYQMSDFQSLVTRYIDADKNNMLHLVGRLPPSDRFTLVSGPAFLIQREMQWFEQVSEFIHPAQRVAKNKEGNTPKQVFREAHQQLMKDGAKWVKHTASSSAVFATLIATVAFAGGMHVPGGTSSITGLPLLLHKKSFAMFATADAISLLLSVISILMFLKIITSRYAEDDFLLKLPKSLMYGISFLFISISTMLLGFGCALLLLISPDGTYNRVSVLLYASMIAVLGMSLPLLYHIARPIHGWGIFRNNKGRPLH